MNLTPYCLLIDNDEDDREVFELALTESGCSLAFRGFESGPAALAWLDNASAQLPQYIFIDMNMPLMNGPQCLHAIQQRPALGGIPVYMYSTAANPRSVEELQRNGVTAFLEKPASYGGLVTLLATIFQSEQAGT